MSAAVWCEGTRCVCLPASTLPAQRAQPPSARLLVPVVPSPM